MKVEHSGANPIQNKETPSVRSTRAHAPKEAKDGERAGAKERVSHSGEDVHAEISPKAKEFAQAKAVAHGAPDVREDKIAELKARIAAGKYEVDADAIADRLVDDHMRMAGIQSS